MPVRAQPFTLDTIDTYRNVADAQIHPDGTSVAFVVGYLTHPRGKNVRSNIYVADLRNNSVTPFTSADACEAHPRWSPDGKWLAFVSDRAQYDVFQLYLIARGGGEAQPLTQGSGILEPYRDITIFKWSPDGSQIAFLRKDPEEMTAVERRAEGYDQIEFEVHPRFTRVWLLDIATRTTRPVTRGDVHVWEFEWSPDGSELALVVSAEPFEWAWYDAYLARVAVKGGAPRKILSRPGKQIGHPAWSPDGNHIAFVSGAMSDRGIIGGDLYVTELGGRNVRRTSEGFAGTVSGIAWVNSHTLIASGYERGDAALVQFDVEGAYETLWHDSSALQESYSPKFSRSPEGIIAAVCSAPGMPREVWTLDASDPDAAVWNQVTNLNAPCADLATGEHEIVHWTSADGKEIQGILVRPPGAKKGKRLPLIVNPHGGPTGITANEYFSPTRWVYHLTNRGFAVFLPNYRGSAGWGIEFSEANLGDMGGMDFVDIMTGVDALVARGIADPQRLGFGGWSYGGFLTAWAITQTDRFRAAVAGAAVTNWRSFHGTSYLGPWDQLYMQANPYAPGGNYDKFSPMAHIQNAKTPTLVLHGEKDGDVPVSQGYELYRALRERGVETAMVIYPREPHAVTETPHVKDMIERICEWFERHLKD